MRAALLIIAIAVNCLGATDCRAADDALPGDARSNPASTNQQAPTSRPAGPRQRKPLTYPDYPSAGRRQLVGGYVVAQFRIDAEGRAQSPVIVAADRPDIFGKPCLEFVRRLRFDVPAEWWVANPEGIDEYYCLFEIEGPSTPPKISSFPGMSGIAITTRKVR
jgi:Gram-negative bacterial TonB protein C-terminal